MNLMPTTTDDAISYNTAVYKGLLKRKRDWTPIEPQAAPVEFGSELTINKGLALRILELPVGQLVQDADAKELRRLDFNKDCSDLITSNIKDEDKHDLALNRAYAKMSMNISEHDKTAEQLLKAWMDSSEPDILKALIIERSVFFVILPIFRFLGNVGLRTISSEISGDETVHVGTNQYLCKLLGMEPTKALNNLRRETVAWLVQDLDISQRPEDSTIDPKYWNPSFWLKASDSLFHTGKADGLSQTRAARVPAFFETDAVELPDYY